MNIHLIKNIMKKRSKLLKINSIILFSLILITMTINQSCSSASYDEGDKVLNKILKSKQYKDGKFINYNSFEELSLWQGLGVFWDMTFVGNNRTPDDSIPRRMVDLKYFNNKDDDHLSVTWLGHSSLMINIDGYKILTDPVLESSLTWVGPSRYNGDIPVNMNDIVDIDVIVISHNHYDHLNEFSIEFLNERTKLFVVPLMVGAQLESWGVSRDKIMEFDWWDEHNYDENLLIAATPSQHFSGRGVSDKNETLWASWVIRTKNHNIYFSGDTGYSQSFKDIGKKYGPFDLTMLECGAYNEKWKNVHMFPEQTVQAHLDLNGKVLHPIHWGTFNLALHPWYEPMHRVSAAAEKNNVNLALPIAVKQL